MSAKNIGTLYVNETRVNRSNGEMLLVVQVQYKGLLPILGEGKEGVRCVNLTCGESYVKDDTKSMACLSHTPVQHGPGERFRQGSLVQEWMDVPSSIKVEIQKSVMALVRQIEDMDWSCEADIDRQFSIVKDAKTKPSKLVEVIHESKTKEVASKPPIKKIDLGL